MKKLYEIKSVYGMKKKLPWWERVVLKLKGVFARCI